MYESLSSENLIIWRIDISSSMISISAIGLFPLTTNYVTNLSMLMLICYILMKEIKCKTVLYFELS